MGKPGIWLCFFACLFVSIAQAAWKTDNNRVLLEWK